MKKITAGELVSLVAVKVPGGLKTGMVLNRLHYHYCGPMRVRGKCTEECRNCQPALYNVFARLSQGTFKDPYAFLVYSIRKEVAEIMEENEVARAECARDMLGQPTDENPFELLLREL